MFYPEFGRSLRSDAAAPTFLKQEHLAFFCTRFMEESAGLDGRLKGMSVVFWSTVAHLLLISRDEYSILLKVAAERLIPHAAQTMECLSVTRF